jgi:hypothetical protein
VAIGAQQSVAQSPSRSHSGLQAKAPLLSKVEQPSPSQQWRAPPHGWSSPEQEHSDASAQKPLSALAKGTQHPVAQSLPSLHGGRHPA